MEFALLSAIPFALAFILATSVSSPYIGKRIQTYVLAGTLASLFVIFLSYFPDIEKNAIEQSVEWMPSLGLNLTFYLDGLSLMFALIVTGIGAAIFFYSGYYFDDLKELTRFNALLMGFTGAMLALVLAGNIITLFIAWELTSIISFLLIGFKGNKYESARFGATQALLITGGGGLALILGLLLLGASAGEITQLGEQAENGFAFTANLAEILNTDTELLHNHSYYTFFTILILLGCFTKSAQFPFHFWLPGAMSAPTPASAFLHSATMVKAGIYLIARLYPVLSETVLWENTLLIVGLTTMLWGAFFAIQQQDLKGLLAYSTVSKLGAIVALLALPNGDGLKAAFIGIMAHALYKSALFLVVGTVDHNTGTRMLDKVGGLRHKMPYMFGVTVISALSMAGVPFFFGFVSKEVLLDAFYLAELPIHLAIVLVASAFTVLAGFILIYDVFLGEEPDDLHYHDSPLPINFGPMALAFCSLTFGFLLQPVVIPMVEAAKGKEISLYLFPGFTTVFMMSLSVLVAGAILFWIRSALMRLHSPLPRGTDWFKGAMNALNAVGDFALRLQNGRVRFYLASILGSVGIVLIGSFIFLDVLPSDIHYLPQESIEFNLIDVPKIALIILSLGAALASILSNQHLKAALALGIVGYAVGGLFLLEPAPDVALVQFLVETLATVLIIIMLGRIDINQRMRLQNQLWGTPKGRLRDSIVSVMVGGSVSFFAYLAVINRVGRETISDWYLENTYSEVGVQDIVAAVLTDFRGTDTLFEIAVFSTAAIGIISLLLYGKDNSYDLAPRQEQIKYPIFKTTQEMSKRDLFGSTLSTPFTRLVATIVLPFVILISLAHVLYGGYMPGDGFTGGVVAGLGLMIWYIVFGYDATYQRFQRISSSWLMRVGLLVSFLNAAFPLLIDKPFFAHLAFKDFTPPAGLHFSSTLFFEIGIALTIFGSVGMIAAAIGHPRNVRPYQKPEKEEVHVAD